jgi:type I restriction enzyme, S subunit
VPINYLGSGLGLFDGDWVESKDQDPAGSIRLLQLADIGIGKFLDKSSRYVNNEAFHRLSCNEVFPGDVLIARMPDPIGRACVLPEGVGRTITVVDVAVLRVNTAIAHPEYLSFVFNSSWFTKTAELLLAGSTRQRISRSALGRIRVPLPDPQVQAEIAEYLGRETTGIDTMVSKLDDLAEELKHRSTEVSTRLVFGLAPGQRHSAADAHSPLAGIPEHWSRTKFGYDFFESTERNGDQPPGPLLSISEYRGVELNTRTDGQQASLDVSKYRVVRPGQLAANMMWLNHGGLGVSSVTGYISPDYKAFWISKRFEPRYVHHLFRSSRYIDYFAAIATGVRPNAQRVTKTVLDATPVPLPALDEQVRIANELDDVIAKIEGMLTKVADLKALLLERRAALITDVVTGRKAVA